MDPEQNAGGFSFPFAIDEGTGAVRMSSYEEDIRESVLLTLMTAKGERPMRPEFGSRLLSYAFEVMDTTTMNLIRQEVITCLTTWEERIGNISVDFERRDKEGVLLVTVRYAVRQDGTRGAVTLPLNLR